MNERIVYLNGRFLPFEEAHISPDDRGFLFADGVYEALRHYPRTGLFRVEEHLRRLDHSLRELRIEREALARLPSILVDVIRLNDLHRSDAVVYLQITRGVAPRAHAFPPGSTRPTVYVSVQPLEPLRRKWDEGVTATLVVDQRWARCDIKSTSLLANLLLATEAREAGAAEAILLRDGHLTEGASSSVFVIHDGTVHLPPYAPALLPGTTRDFVVELLAAAGREVREQAIPRAMLFAAEEIWIASATREVLPVTRLDGRAVGTGVPGPGWQAVDRLFQEHKRAGAR